MASEQGGIRSNWRRSRRRGEWADDIVDEPWACVDRVYLVEYVCGKPCDRWWRPVAMGLHVTGEGMVLPDGPTTVGKAGDFRRVRAKVVLEEIRLKVNRGELFIANHGGKGGLTRVRLSHPGNSRPEHRRPRRLVHTAATDRR